jgi:hypothetical protein
LNKYILNTGIQDFIIKNIATDSLSVLLSNPIFDGANSKEIINQIIAAKKCENKLPTWFHTAYIYYPLPLQIEQTSSEIAAQYKASLLSGKTGADICGGLGVDSFYFAKNTDTVFHVEINTELSEIVRYNFKVLGVKNIQCILGDSLTFLEKQTALDWVYIDPSRRDQKKGKVFLLEDCSPNIKEILPLLWSKTQTILIKTAPILDIKAGLKDLSHVKEVQAIGVGNEVKELLWILEKDYQGPAALTAVLLESSLESTKFTTSIDIEANSMAPKSEVLAYLYEPHAAVMKIGAFKSVAQQMGLFKLHDHSHLYTATNLVPFPGRSFRVTAVLPYNKKNLKIFTKTKANVSVRNFKSTVADLRKKHSLQDGGHVYMFFSTDLNNKAVVIVCEKI